MATQGIYWLGSDGNVYAKGGGGNGAKVTNYGKAISLGAQGAEAANGSVQGYRVDDPNAPRQSAPSNPNNTGGGGGGGSAAPAKPDKSNDIALQNAGLAAVDSQTSAGIDRVNQALARLYGQYDTETASNEGNYRTQSDTNQNNLQKNKQTAYVNAAQGRQGLFAKLASMGALNGSGITRANNAVKTGANEDLSGAADNYSTNQQGLDTAIGTYRQQDKMRRDNAGVAADNARTNVYGDAARTRQAFYSNLSNDYADMGDSDNANKFSGLAAGQYPAIASANLPNSDIAYSGAAYTPSTLASYQAGANSTQVNSTPGSTGAGGMSGIPGLVAADKRKLALAT